MVETKAKESIWAEIAILLALSLGRSGVYSVVNLIGRITDSTPLGQQVTALNPVRSPRPYLDLTYQLLAIVFALIPVALAWYFLNVRPGARPTSEVLGVDWHRRLDEGDAASQPAWRRVLFDFRGGGLLFLAVGIPGLAFYALGRALGITVAVQASALDPYWWTIPVLILAAFQNGMLEEFIVVGYLYERTRDLGWSQTRALDWRFLAFSAILRGSYHLYQGIGPFFGNAAMGLLFAWWFTSRFGKHRIMSLVIAHTLIDIIAFVGYALAPEGLLRLLGFAT